MESGLHLGENLIQFLSVVQWTPPGWTHGLKIIRLHWICHGIAFFDGMLYCVKPMISLQYFQLHSILERRRTP
jgi:hypothetical protein